MAETHSKRQREETQILELENDPKRYKSYNQILSFLDDEEDEPTQDLSEILTTFQQELTSDDFPDLDPTLETDPCEDLSLVSAASECSPSSDEEKEKVIRHLLEASDDELGIPNNAKNGVLDGVDGDDLVEINGGDLSSSFAICDGLWEIEDEAANYYTLLQSELFM